VFNNTEGDADAKVRLQFKEPAWNYQVVHVLNAEGQDLVPRLAKDHSLGALAQTMVQGLTAAKQPVPAYLELLMLEQQARKRGTQRAIFGTT
jgi:predicted FMN-binding regulatory protein PaiB